MAINSITTATLTLVGGVDDTVAANEDPLSVQGTAIIGTGSDSGTQAVILRFDGDPAKQITVNLSPGAGYTVGGPGNKTITYNFNITYAEYKALGLTTGTDHTVTFQSIAANVPTTSNGDTYSDLTCFVRGTCISTPEGERAV